MAKTTVPTVGALSGLLRLLLVAGSEKRENEGTGVDAELRVVLRVAHVRPTKEMS